MRIALIYLGRRGAGLPISLEIVRNLVTTDEVIVVLSKTAAKAADWKNFGVKTVAVSTYENLPQAIWSWIGQRRIRRLARLIADLKPDVMFFPMFYTWNPFLQSLLHQIPSVIAVHDPRPHPGLGDKFFQWLEDRSIRQATRCLIFSKSLAPDLSQRGVPPDRIDFIKLGMFDYNQIKSDIKPKPSIDETSPITLLFFGRITAYKGLDILLNAYQQVSHRYNVKLIIAGDGKLLPYQSLLETCKGVEIINRWIADEEIPTIFSRSDIVILPYTSASQSGVIPIAAGFAIPVIATKTGGIPEQIEDGSNGLLVEPGSVEQLAQAIERLHRDQSLRTKLGRNLQDDYRNKYNWKESSAIIRTSLNKARLT